MVFDFEKEYDKEYKAMGFKNQRKSLSRLEQTGTTNIKVDAKRKALTPGKRISASGKTYWETRKNRSDAPGKRI